MFLYGLMPIVLSIILFLNKSFILDFAEKINAKNDRPINRQIMARRFDAAVIFLFVLGLIELIKSL